MAKQQDKQFKLDAVQYYQDHKDLGVRGCAENLGIGYSTLTKWLKDFRESGDIPVRGSGNYKQSQNPPKYRSTIKSFTQIVGASMLQRDIKKQPKTCSVATRRKLFRGIMRA